MGAGCVRASTGLLVLISAVLAIFGWALEATDTTVKWGPWLSNPEEADFLVAMSPCFSIPLGLMTLVIVANLAVHISAKRKSNEP
jgi:hypothetical protein|tara:strand:+ start:239 stop:493 length:255 start_codon:yes stop_codon:yes gene_type:complete